MKTRQCVLRAVWLLCMAAGCAVAHGAERGIDALPELQGDQLETIRNEPGPPEDHRSRAFGPLLTNARQWDLTMRQWSANPSLVTGWATRETVDRFTRGLTDDAGEAVALFGIFRERQTLGDEFPGVERWLIELVDHDDPSVPAGPVVILFVETNASVLLTPPQDGWFVSAAARYYKPMLLPTRQMGQQQVFPAFVGAVFRVSPLRGEPISEIFVWVALALAVMIAVSLTVAIIIISKRGATTPLQSTPTPAVSDDASLGATDPADALARLRREASREEDEETHG
ncbi:MAG: hypothetical protein EA380_04495 [Phycisphaeraceae bacterium]|nr:MAG: hypothetical protein EA380_04495 [Phycisphaeraceae bacterium]